MPQLATQGQGSSFTPPAPVLHKLAAALLASLPDVLEEELAAGQVLKQTKEQAACFACTCRWVCGAGAAARRGSRRPACFGV